MGGVFTGKRAVGKLDEATFRKVFKWLLTALAVWLIGRAAFGLFGG